MALSASSSSSSALGSTPKGNFSTSITSTLLLHGGCGRRRMHAFAKSKLHTVLLASTRRVRNDIHIHTATLTLDKDLVEPAAAVGYGGGNQEGRDGGGEGGGGGGGGGGGDGWSDGKGENGQGGGSGRKDLLGIILALWEAFIRGWKARVRTDPQFPFKVLTEAVIGVGACVLGDMASRPNFGLNELDFVFSTVVVGSILNFTLMYLLAPSSAGADINRLPSVFAGCPPGHMFEPGAYTVLDRFGTFVYKGVVFGGVGFVAGLFGTAVSTLLLNARKKMDPNFTTQNKPPPTLLNAATWALHMGISSNLRYQAINGVEYALASALNPAPFKASVFAIRALNNVLGGTSFVLLARFTGSQKSSSPPPPSKSPPPPPSSTASPPPSTSPPPPSTASTAAAAAPPPPSDGLSDIQAQKTRV